MNKPESSLAQRLRDQCRKLRTTSVPLSDMIPLMQQAADELDRAAHLSNQVQEPVAWGVFVMVDGAMTIQYPVALSPKNAEEHAAIYKAKERVEIRPLYASPQAVPSEQPIAEQPKSEQQDSAYSTSRVGQINKTALPEQPEDFWIRQHTAARLAEMDMRRQVDRIERELEDFCLWLNESGLQHVAHELASRVVILPLPPGELAGAVPSDKKGLPSSAAPAGQEDARDAKRYRALRQQGGPGAKLFVRGAWSGYLGDYRHLIGEELDAAIDAMSATTKEN